MEFKVKIHFTSQIDAKNTLGLSAVTVNLFRVIAFYQWHLLRLSWKSRFQLVFGLLKNRFYKEVCFFIIIVKFIDLISLRLPIWTTNNVSTLSKEDKYGIFNNTYAINLTMTILVEISGIEPLTSCVQGRRSPSWAISPIISFGFHSHIVPWYIKINSCNEINLPNSPV